MTAAVLAVVAALALAGVLGWLMTRRAGNVRATGSNTADDIDTSDLGLSADGPTVVHFSASWCGPCTQVRRVVNQVCDDLGDVAHVEIDMDANPGAARRLSVLSLPTTGVSRRPEPGQGLIRLGELFAAAATPETATPDTRRNGA